MYCSEMFEIDYGVTNTDSNMVFRVRYSGDNSLIMDQGLLGVAFWMKVTRNSCAYGQQWLILLFLAVALLFLKSSAHFFIELCMCFIKWSRCCGLSSSPSVFLSYIYISWVHHFVWDFCISDHFWIQPLRHSVFMEVPLSKSDLIQT